MTHGVCVTFREVHMGLIIFNQLTCSKQASWRLSKTHVAEHPGPLLLKCGRVHMPTWSRLWCFLCDAHKQVTWCDAWCTNSIQGEKSTVIWHLMHNCNDCQSTLTIPLRPPIWPNLFALLDLSFHAPCCNSPPTGVQDTKLVLIRNVIIVLVPKQGLNKAVLRGKASNCTEGPRNPKA